MYKEDSWLTRSLKTVIGKFFPYEEIIKEGYEVRGSGLHYNELIDHDRNRKIGFEKEIMTDITIYYFDKKNRWDTGDPFTEKDFELIERKLLENNSNSNTKRKLVVNLR